MPRVLLLLPTTTYRTEAFVSAASRLGVDVTVASEQPNTLTRLNPAGLLTLDFKDPQEAAQRVVEFSTSHRIDAVAPGDSQVVVAGAAIIEVRGLDDAKAVSDVEDATISAHTGQRLVPLPEGSRYLGFISARAKSPEAVEAALRESHSQLEFIIEPFVDREDDGTARSERSTKAV